ncbi:Oxo-4-hydroxy-4-carboxy-5-ureidoimidazoline decarboxylase [Collybia nuda]|uniref:Oxo-4-hydroxy-4-carboxy-5-ureidoimidazoline decarboxylase n=1 Tax=Collybia nuda TaxID=64659 RepID=A0A9P5Y840_9AGAR|nr:Oxo-4-hydroxy-4-carboxy-5-ureidoimidazoline decarboxylase [Collybia nuda]
MNDKLPPLSGIFGVPSHKDSALGKALAILFEPSPTLISRLEPQLALLQQSPSSYSELIDTALATITGWDTSAQSDFIAGHPRIGESKNLSNLSAKEQSGTGISPTPPEVLARLAHLNACYEAKYPGLRYITFVNGRPRHAIAEELEDLLGFNHSLLADEPALIGIESMDITGDLWRGELRRAIEDIGLIAKSRLVALGVE